MTDLSKQTAKQRENFFYMEEAMKRLEWDIHNTIEMSGRIPEEWHDIAQAPPARRKVQVNLGLDEAVLRFFKSMGAGYGPRINEVLKSFMHARLAGVVKGADTINHYKRREEYFSGPKPAFGHLVKALEPDWQDAPDPDPIARRKVQLREAMQRRYADDAGAKD
jgi:uncharacterized protein (DUF4415 family)